MNSLLRGFFAAAVLLAAHGAQAGGISDNGVNGYWGADGHGYGDVIGSSVYDISGAEITRVGSVLTVTIKTNFAGHAGVQTNQAVNGIGYGDVFLGETWNPFGSDAHHSSDNAAKGTVWSYGFNLDNRWSNTGGTFKLYELNGATNALNVRNSETFMKCKLGTDCYYRDGQATAVNTSSSTVLNTGITGTWTVLADQQLQFTINVSNTDLINLSSMAMHWGETCQNDVIEGLVKVPLPDSLPLLGIGLGAMLMLRRRPLAAVAAA